jgi:carbonic anhydrase/acetyltransferase-like protein (isoleucine patch superfamily)
VAIYALGERTPSIHETSVWPCAVLRGDDGAIRVGARSSVQDGSVVHATQELDTIIGEDCVIGHMVHLEGCVVEPHALVGNGSVVLHEAVIRSYSLVGSNAVVPNRFEVPTGCMALGVPARLRENAVVEGDFEELVRIYVERGRTYRASLRRID